MMSRYRYMDPIGQEANITLYDDGSARLVIYSVSGTVSHDKSYRSLRSARIAMGKISYRWIKI